MLPRYSVLCTMMRLIDKSYMEVNGTLSLLSQALRRPSVLSQVLVYIHYAIPP